MNDNHKSLGMRLSMASLAVGSGHARETLVRILASCISPRIAGRAAGPCIIPAASCNALNLANTSARPPCPQTTLEAHARGGTLFRALEETLFTGEQRPGGEYSLVNNVRGEHYSLVNNVRGVIIHWGTLFTPTMVTTI